MPKRGMPAAVCIWPGLPSLWERGSWAGLGLAVVFAGLLNVLLVASTVWTDWLEVRWRTIGWVVVIGIWTASLAVGRRRAGCGASLTSGADGESTAAERPDRSEDLFREVTLQYLQGNWFEVERQLEELIRSNGRDVEALLMRATVLRHLERPREAAAGLRRLELLDDSEKWGQEIRREWDYLSHAQGQEAD